MTQTLNGSNTSLNGGKETLAKEASTGKRAGRQHLRVGHVGLLATNPAASAEFYRDLFGIEITGESAPDHPLGASAFLTSRLDATTHEMALFANPEFAHVALKVSSLAEFRSFHARVVERNIPIKFAFNHHESFAFYFEDPDGNLIEVYWPTGDLSWNQPYVEPLDLSQPDEVLLKDITTGHLSAKTKGSYPNGRDGRSFSPSHAGTRSVASRSLQAVLPS
jgi:catechol-2,3-dioxygenase